MAAADLSAGARYHSDERLGLQLFYSQLNVVIARFIRATHLFFFAKEKMGPPDKPGDDEGKMVFFVS
jgi:hypothetical protein